MKTLLGATEVESVLARLHTAMETHERAYPGESAARQPVHTVYGGAHLFKRDSARKLGELALRSMDDYAPNCCAFARALGLRDSHTLPDAAQEALALTRLIERAGDSARQAMPGAWLAHTVHARVLEKLKREPVEDFRIDFEDGFGNRPDDEEDATAQAAATEVAAGIAARSLPPFIGIRIKPFTRELAPRAARTLDLFIGALCAASGGQLPDNFVVTLPKVVAPEQVTALVDLLDALEPGANLKPGNVKIELMVETTQSIIGPGGAAPLRALVAAARGRCIAAHFGVYDYTASCSITAEHQHMRHSACDFARDVMQVTLASTGVWLSDGATNIMPVAPHRPAPGAPLTPEQVADNRCSVHRAWKLHFDDTRHSLQRAIYQGWDLNPAQLPTRYAAVYAFFLEGLDAAGQRLANFIEKAAQATLVGDVFDDAATGQGLLNFFIRGLNCGAITEAEALATGLTLDELRSRSFVKIMAGRRAAAAR